MYFPSWKKIADLNHYCRAGLVVSTVSCGFIILFLCFGFPSELVFDNVISTIFTTATPAELFFDELILTIFSTAAVVSHLFSNATYIAGTIDQFQEPDPTKKKKTTIERWFTLAGIIIGLIGGITLALTLPSITFFTFLSTTTVTTGAIAGLCNRFSGIRRRPLFEQFCLIASAIIGASMGCSLLYFGIPIMHITGVITFVTGGPPPIASTIFISLVTSLFMSGADYFSKSILYLPRLFKKKKEDRHHEYEGSFFGFFLSLLAIAFFVTHLHLFVSAKLTLTGFNIAATTVTLFAKCFGIDGICSRIGRTLDGLFDKEDSHSEKAVKVILVITGFAGLMVLTDICSKIKNYICCNKTPDPSPTSPPLVIGSNNLINERTKLDSAETRTNNKSIQIPLSPLLVVTPSSPRPPSPLNPLSPLPPSREPSTPSPSSTDSSSESAARSPSTSWWNKFSSSYLWTTMFYPPTPRGTSVNSFNEERPTKKTDSIDFRASVAQH